MEKFPVLQNELARLEKLYSYNILDMQPEDRFDDLSKLAASILDVPICLITLMDSNWQVFISNVGTEMKGNHRELAFCRYCVVQENILEITDTTKDDRVSDNPLVVNDPKLRYYIGAPLIDEEGFIIGTVCGYDLQPRKMSDFQRRALTQITSTVMQLIHLRKVDLDQKKYKDIFNLSQDILCILSKDGFLKEFNPAISNMLNVGREDLLRLPFSNWIHPEDLSTYEQLQQSNETKIRKGIVFRLLNSEGETITVEWSFYYDAQLSIMVISGHNITEAISRQSQLESAVKNANEAIEMKDQFLSDMSHEIRTPLASIVGFSELLSASDLTSQQKSYSEAVDIAAEHLVSIVNEVLDVYKLDHHEVALDPAPEDLLEILTKIKKLYSLKATSKGIDLLLNFDDGIPVVLNIDRTRLTQIVSNLTSNAIKFTSKGSVTISARLKSKDENSVLVELSVEDTGIGIDKDRQEAIFNRFTQETDATWKKYGGTGLGLSIAKQLVELHESHLELSSELNQGTRFSFDVNFSLSDLDTIISEVPQQQSSEVEVPSLHGLRVLVAEDNKNLQILCKTFIERNDGEIILVSNGQEAIKYLSKNEVDVILIDMHMPVTNGIEVAKYVREELQLSCPIIACSANLLDVETTDGDLSYLDEFITKPYTEYRLISEILHQFESKTLNVTKDHFEHILKDLGKQEGDELVREFKQIFSGRIPQDIKDLIDARKGRDFRALLKKAHFLSTTLLTLKFNQGLTISTELEKAIDAGQEASALMLTDQLIDYLNSALKEIE
ncbi:MAG: ATP-binding protein [Crocinitomicaceae bacterium]